MHLFENETFLYLDAAPSDSDSSFFCQFRHVRTLHDPVTDGSKLENVATP